MKVICFLIVCLIACGAVCAQSIPVYNHSFAEPYIANPADVAATGYREVTFLSRRQWMGSETAVSASILALQMPVSGKLGMGVLLVNDRQGLLNSMSGLATLGYSALLAGDVKLSVGLSVGGLRRSIDQDELNVTDVSDPLIADAAFNRTSLAGNAGLGLQVKQWNLGVALGGLFDQAGINSKDVGSRGNWMASLGYRFAWTNMRLEPQFRIQSMPDQEIQVGGVCALYLAERFWVGMAYGQYTGSSLFAGAGFARVFRVGYGYETGPSGAPGATKGTHELLINIRFGNKSKLR